MLRIVGIPLAVKEFCSHFFGMLKRPEQRKNFEAVIAGLSVCENRTIAGIHQQLVEGPTYESLHHFMSGSPWSVDQLIEGRRKYIKEWLLKKSDLTAGSVEKFGMKLIECIRSQAEF